MSQDTDLIDQFLGRAHNSKLLDKFHVTLERENNLQIRARIKHNITTFYKQQIKQPFSYKNEEAYKIDQQYKQSVKRLRDGIDQIDYFTKDSNGELRFKGKPLPDKGLENHEQHPLYTLTKFNLRRFCGNQFNKLHEDTAEINFSLNKKYKTEAREEIERSERPRRPRLHTYSDMEDTKQSFSLNVMKVPVAMRLRSTISTKKNDSSTDKRKRSSTKNSESNYNPNNSLKNTIQQQSVDDITELLASNESFIIQRIRSLSINPNAFRSSLRIHKEQFRKVFMQRYGRDRLSSYLSLQHIEDYDSILRTVNKLLRSNNQQGMYMTFVTFDTDRDNLITGGDMIEMLPYVAENHLLQEDFLKLSAYIRQNKGKRDLESSPELFLTELNYSTFKNFKEGTKQSRIRNPKVKRLRKELFINSLYQKQRSLAENGLVQSVPAVVKKVVAEPKNYEDCPEYFSINFTTFKKIFKNTRPMFFYDLLYVLAGVKYKHLKYPAQQYPAPQDKPTL